MPYDKAIKSMFITLQHVLGKYYRSVSCMLGNKDKHYWVVERAIKM